jgi:hypothetical protein
LGFDKNLFMENTKKIAVLIILVLSMICCNSQKGKKLNLTNNLFKDDKGNIVFRIPDYEKMQVQQGMTIKNDSINFSFVYDVKNKEYIKTNDIIDWETFQNIFNNPENEIKVNEDQYTVDLNCYFEDKNNFYLYPFLGTKLFMIRNNNYDILGGAYLKINDEIYWRAEKIDSVDIKTFKVIKLKSSIDYHEGAIGIDKNHLYKGNKVMGYEEFKSKYSNYDKLKSKYFKKQKNSKT